MRFDTDRRYPLPLAPEDLWDTVSQVDDYQRWWPWLRHFDGARLASGLTWRCAVRPPLPYVVRFHVALDEVVAPHTVRASISGDVVGTAWLEITGQVGGCEARLVSSLEPHNRLLKAMARIAAPVVRQGHDWVLDSGARQFIAHTGDADARPA